MTDNRLAAYIFILTGGVLVLLSFPYIRGITVGRLQSADLLPKLKLRPRDQEIISGAGPNLSLMIMGVALIGLGVLELLNS